MRGVAAADATPGIVRTRRDCSFASPAGNRIPHSPVQRNGMGLVRHSLCLSRQREQPASVPSGSKGMKRVLSIIVLSMGLLLCSGGVAVAQDNGVVDANGPNITYGDLSPGPGTTVINAPGGTTGRVTATDGNASGIGPGSASAAPGSVKGGVAGNSLLGPDGTYSASD